MWDNPERAQELGKERSALEAVVKTIDTLDNGLGDARDLLDMAVEENDESAVNDIRTELAALQKELETLEFRRMFSGELDPSNCYVEIQAGSGGTEAQDWANMLLRMYLRWIEAHGFKGELMEVSEAEVAGIKGATIRVEGEYAYGWLRTETGVHRLVRKARSTLATVATPRSRRCLCHRKSTTILILKLTRPICVLTYTVPPARAVSTLTGTESAVRITHIPTNTVAQCQNDRSQHKNKDQAMKQLKAKLYELELQKRSAEAQALEDTKSDIGWGSQIRSYVLDDARIKDLRTGVETRNTQAVLDGDLDQFIEASLKKGL